VVGLAVFACKKDQTQAREKRDEATAKITWGGIRKTLNRRKKIYDHRAHKGFPCTAKTSQGGKESGGGIRKFNFLVSLLGERRKKHSSYSLKGVLLFVSLSRLSLLFFPFGGGKRRALAFLFFLSAVE